MAGAEGCCVDVDTGSSAGYTRSFVSKNIVEGKVLVVGLGYRTGVAAAGFLSARGASVTVSDIKSGDELKDLIAKLASDVKVIAGHQNTEILDAGFDLVVLSPGVSAGIPLIKEALNRKIPVISEIELAFRNMQGASSA